MELEHFRFVVDGKEVSSEEWDEIMHPITYYITEPNGKILEMATIDFSKLEPKAYRSAYSIVDMLKENDYVETDKNEKLKLVYYKKVGMVCYVYAFKDNDKTIKDSDINAIYRADEKGEYRKIWERK